ncbi:MAG: hypothetical protein IIC61_01025 [Proteobacteria bacterium]|nr:hypothetical protein [Pseudomonadota bacterium]
MERLCQCALTERYLSDQGLDRSTVQFIASSTQSALARVLHMLRVERNVGEHEIGGMSDWSKVSRAYTINADQYD